MNLLSFALLLVKLKFWEQTAKTNTLEPTLKSQLQLTAAFNRIVGLTNTKGDGREKGEGTV